MLRRTFFLLAVAALARVASAEPAPWIEMGISSNTPGGSTEWNIDAAGRMTRAQQNSMLPSTPFHERKLSGAEMASVRQALQKAAFDSLPRSIGNGGRGEPTQYSLVVTSGGQKREVYLFSNAGHTPQADRFFQVWNLLQSLTGSPTRSTAR